MPTRRVLKSVLENFLDTYMSRNSDYHGYWVFGFLVNEIREVRFDLLTTPGVAPATPADAAAAIAAATFQIQLQKARLSLLHVNEATLTLTKMSRPVRGHVDSRPCMGYTLSLSAKAVTHHGKCYQRMRAIFAAPHNPAIERQRTI